MAHLLTQTDIYAVTNLMVQQLTGQKATIQAVDSSSFISCGELITTYSTENIMNSLTMLIGDIMIAVRESQGDFNLIRAIETGIFTHRLQKISFYADEACAEGAWNTNLFTNIKTGFTNGRNVDSVSGDDQSTKSMWEQKIMIPLVNNFSGSDVWSYGITIPEVQIAQAWRSEGELNSFISGMLMEHQNNINRGLSAFRHSVVLNYIGGVYDMEAAGKMPGSVVDLTYEFNKKYSSTYTRDQILSVYQKEFLGFMVSTIKKYQKLFEKDSSNYHWTPAKQDEAGNDLALLRHTPRAMQKLFMYEPLFIDAEAQVLPELFRDEELKIQYEGVMIWQNENDPSAISVTPAIPTDDSTQTSGTEVDLDYVVGVLFDTDAMMVDYQMDRAETTPLEARKLYRNVWMHIARNGINDFTEKGIIFIMSEDAAPEP